MHGNCYGTTLRCISPLHLAVSPASLPLRTLLTYSFSRHRFDDRICSLFGRARRKEVEPLEPSLRSSMYLVIVRDLPSRGMTTPHFVSSFATTSLPLSIHQTVSSLAYSSTSTYASLYACLSPSWLILSKLDLQLKKAKVVLCAPLSACSVCLCAEPWSTAAQYHMPGRVALNTRAWNQHCLRYPATFCSSVP